MENQNCANGAPFDGKDRELTGTDRDSHEVSVLALHLCCNRRWRWYTSTPLLLQRRNARSAQCPRPTCGPAGTFQQIGVRPQADLADRLDVSRQTINAIEAGRYDPSQPLLSRWRHGHMAIVTDAESGPGLSSLNFTESSSDARRPSTGPGSLTGRRSMRSGRVRK